jgi:hypothetical protein
MDVTLLFLCFKWGLNGCLVAAEWRAIGNMIVHFFQILDLKSKALELVLWKKNREDLLV